MLVAAVLMNEGLLATEAIERIRARRPLVALSATQVAAVYEYGQRIATSTPRSR
jgi:hypothetical protein